MAKVFLSHAEEDGNLAADIAQALEGAGVTTWHYRRDSLPGPSYLKQIGVAIEESEIVVVVISNDAIGSKQMTSEIVRALEWEKDLVPVLWGLTHAVFQKLQPEWRGAFGAAASIEIPQTPDGVRAILPRLLGGLAQLGVVSMAEERPRATAASTNVGAKETPSVNPASPPSTQVSLTARFDRTAYPPGEDSLAYCLAELRVTIEGEVVDDGPGADVALVLDVSGSMDKPNRYPLLREAVRRFALGLGPRDRVSVILFTDAAKTVVPFLGGDAAADDPDRLIRAMDESGMLFGPSTLLAPGLQLAAEGLGLPDRSSGRVRRVYVLTDGELHDTPECFTVLRDFRQRRAEVHVYGFGDGFDAAALKRLVSDQIGGTVKPILNEADIVKTFAHVAAVNRRLVGQEGTLAVTFSTEVACGDAWVFQPTARYLGPVKGRRVEHIFGGIEAGRQYSLLLEVRLSLGSEPVGLLEAGWIEKGLRASHRIEVVAPRAAQGDPVPEVRRALDALEALRAEDNTEALLASYKARRELAELENRDPNLIAALDRMIAAMTGDGSGMDIEVQDLPTTSTDLLYLESDQSSVWEGPASDESLGRELREFDRSALPDEDALKCAISLIGDYIRRGEITPNDGRYHLVRFARDNDKTREMLAKIDLSRIFR